MDHDNCAYIRKVLVDHDPAGGPPSVALRLTRISSLEVTAAYHYPDHLHAAGEIIAPRRGEYGCVVNGQSMTVAPGQMVMLQPGDRHEDFYRSGSELLFLIFDLNDFAGQPWRHGIFAPSAGPETRRIAIAPGSAADALAQLLTAAEADDSGSMIAREKIGEALFWQAVAGVAESFLAEPFTAAVRQNIFRRLAMDYFSEHLAGRLDAEAMARHLKMSRRSLEYKCRNAFGSGPGRVFISCKIRFAAQLLEQGESVKTVAERLGFCDQFYFSTVFKRFTGYPPSQLSGSGCFAPDQMPLR